MSAWGVLTDKKKVQDLLNITKTRMNELATKLQLAGLAHPLKNNSKKIKKSMMPIRDLIVKTFPGNPPRTDATDRYPNGQIQTSKDVLEQCNSPELQALVEFNALQKTTSTYLEKMSEPIIHARFNAIGASSCRTSSSDPNLQNQPRLPGVRECFYPRPGYVYLACDYDSQEMRTLAQTCIDIVGRSKLAERYKADRYFDPHMDFARLLANGQKDVDLDELRQHSKVANFGFPGGMGPKGFVHYAKSWGLDITLDQAYELKKKWLIQWPEMNDYFDFISNLTQSGYGAVVIPQTGFRREGCKYTDASNSYFSSLATHISKSAAYSVSRVCYNQRDTALYGSRPVLFIHDEIILETPEPIAHEAAMELEKIMVDTQEVFTPDVPAAASATLMRYWSKKAKRIEENERLVPWYG
jgi:DNA polymerase I-like protein with 3'-5' exonuclease and polymerase domains